jgi:hypothetical protein
MASRITLKDWFLRGKKPTANQFAEWIDSFVHKTEDSIGIDKVTGLQEALDGKAPLDPVAGVVIPVQMTNNQDGYIAVGDITLHNSVRIEYTIIRGVLYEAGSLLLENRANEIIVQQADLDESGFVFSKTISGNELRIAWTDELANGTHGLLYLIDVKRTQIQS